MSYFSFIGSLPIIVAGLKAFLLKSLPVPKWISNWDPDWKPGKMFNDAVYEQILTSRVFEIQLSKFIRSSTLPLYEVLKKSEDNLASSLAQPHFTGQQVDRFMQVQEEFLAKLAAHEEEVPTSSKDEELKAAFKSFLIFKPAKGKNDNITVSTQRSYYSSIFSDGQKACLQQYVVSTYGSSASITEFMFRVDSPFRSFDQGLLGYISSLPASTASVLCNGIIAFFEFLKDSANRVELKFDDLLNENKRMKFNSALATINEQLSRKSTTMHKKRMGEKDIRKNAEEFLEPGKDLLILEAYPNYFLSEPFKEMLTSIDDLARKAKDDGISSSDKTRFQEITTWLMLQLVMFNGGRSQTADLFQNKHFLAKLVAIVDPIEKADHTKIKFHFKGALDQEEFHRYVIGAFDSKEGGKTGAIRLILPKILARGMEQYHFIKSVMNSEEAYLPDGPFFINMDGIQEWICLGNYLYLIFIIHDNEVFLGFILVLATHS